jgi:hypothetical protein
MRFIKCCSRNNPNRRRTLSRSTSCTKSGLHLAQRLLSLAKSTRCFLRPTTATAAALLLLLWCLPGTLHCSVAAAAAHDVSTPVTLAVCTPQNPRQATYGCEASDLVAQPLRLNNGNLLTYPLVCVKVKSEAAVVLLDNDTRSLLHGLGAHTTLQCRQASRTSAARL